MEWRGRGRKEMEERYGEGGTLRDGRHWIRFIDKDDRTYVAFEFNGDFDILSELRVDSLEWEGGGFLRVPLEVGEAESTHRIHTPFFQFSWNG